MRSSVVATALAAIAQTAWAKEMQPTAEVDAFYRSGIPHQQNIANKMAQWAVLESQGLFDSSQYTLMWAAKQDGFVPCVDGKAELVAGDPLWTYQCKELDLYDFVTHAELQSPGGRGSGSWGWTSDDGREFFAAGQYDGVAFMEVSPAGKLIYLGRLPAYSVDSMWREIKSYGHTLVIGSEAQRHGIQFFDLRKLLTIDPASPVLFTNEKDLTSHWTEALPLGRSHNVVVNEEAGYVAAVGAQPRGNLPCDSGLQFLDVKDPANPVYLGCAAGDGYVHDAQCIIYRGPDEKYFGRDICYGYNENTLTIYDVTVKNGTNIISRTSYEGATYTHQGWVIDPMWQDFLVLDDEIDEIRGNGPAKDGFATTYFWDISSLENPKQTGVFKSPARSVDHNQFVVDGLSFQSNYGAGLRVLDVSSVRSDPTGSGVSEVAFFDIHPDDDARGGSLDYTGTWSHYPFFKSGFIPVNTMTRGIYLVKKSDAAFWKR